MTFESITQLQMRELASKRAGDNYGQGTATSGDATSLIDTNGLHALNVDDYKGVWAYINAGTGVGRESWCSASTAITGDLTLVTGTVLDNTSEYELHKRWRFADWNEAIKVAMRTDRLKHLNMMQDRSLTGAADTREFTLPSGIHSIHKITYLADADISTIEQEIPLWEWEVNTGSTGTITNLLRFTGGTIPPASATILLHGTKFPTVPTSDASVITINSELIILQTLAVFTRRFGSRLQARDARDDYAALASESSVAIPGNSRIVEN